MTGTITDPAKFADVIISSHIIPGDIIYMRGGIYKGVWIISIGGTKDAPIEIRPYQNESVIIDGGLQFAKPYVHVFDIEIMDSNPDRTVQQDNVQMNQAGCWLIGCNIHDIHSSGVSWWGSGDGKVCECIIYNNGTRDPKTLEGLGHGIYSHNDLGGAREMSRNIFFDQFGKYTIHIYSGGNNNLLDYTCEDNIIGGDAVHTGGGLGLINFIYNRNVQWGDYCQLGRYGYTHQNKDGWITNNIFIGMQGYTVNADCDLPWLNLTESGNTVWGGEPSKRDGYDFATIPATWYKIIPFSLSVRWIASLVIFNRDSAKTISVDFMGFKEGKYRLINSQNPSETWEFEYLGKPIDIPTIWTSAKRIGDATHPPTWPVFGGFVIESMSIPSMRISNGTPTEIMAHLKSELERSSHFDEVRYRTYRTLGIH